MAGWQADSSMVPELIAAARANPGNGDGIHNVLVVMSHMDSAALRPSDAAIHACTREARRVGPRATERAEVLGTRLDRSRR